jgi:hypothetical protein
MLLTFPASFSLNNDDKLITLQTQRADMEMKITRLTDAIAAMGMSEAIRRALTSHEAELAAKDREILEEAQKAVYGNARRMTEVLVEARSAMGGAVIGPSFGDRLKTGLPLVPTRTKPAKMADPQTLNGLLRRLFASIKIDIEAGEISAKWLDGRVSALTV